MNIKKKLVSIIIIFLMSLASGAYIYIDTSLTPTIRILAQSKAEEVANRGINKAVSSVVEGKYDYKDLIDTKVDSQGKVTMIQSNTVIINKMASDISLEVQNEFEKINVVTEYIPIGSALQSTLISQYGPEIKVEIEPIGIVGIDFKTDFKSEGINQTRHTIYLEITTEVDVVVPLTTKTSEVTTQVPICETIIIGDVPQSYVNVPDEIAPNFYEN